MPDVDDDASETDGGADDKADEEAAAAVTRDEPAEVSPPTGVDDQALDPESEPEPESGPESGPEPDTQSERQVARSPRAVIGVVGVLVVAAVVVAGLTLRHHHSGGSHGLADDVAFQAAGTTVTEDDLARRAQVLHVLYGIQIPTSGSDLATFRRRTAQALATSLVIDKTAQDEGLAVSPQTASATLDKYIASRYSSGSQAAFTQLLSQNHISKQDVLDEVTRQLDGERLFDKVTAGIKITPAQVSAAYQANPGSWNQPQRRDIRDIVVLTHAKATSVLRDLEQGASFVNEAKRFSQDASTKDSGGELGVVSASELNSAFARIAFGAPKGDLFGPVETNLGWYVGQVERVLPAQTTLAQSRTRISQNLAANQALKVWNTYVEKIVDDASVTYASTYKPLPGDKPTDDLSGLTGTGSTTPAPTPDATPSPGE